MTTKKSFFVLFLTAVFFVPFTTSAQVTIGSGEPPRATLDVVASEGIHPGIIVPNVSRILLNATIYTADQTGAIVYVYELGGIATGQTVNVTEVGFYYFDGTLWQSMSGEEAVGFVLNTANATLVRSGTGTEASPFLLARAAITGDVSVPAASNTAAVTAIRGRNVAATAPTTGQALMWDGTNWTPTTPPNTTYTGSTSIFLSGTSFQREALTGDVTATRNSNATTVTAIRGRNVATTAPTAGQVLSWNAATSTWTPTTPATGWLLGGNSTTSTNNILGTTSAQPLRFRTGTGDIADTERMRIAAIGNVAIGTTTTTHRLQVAGGSANASIITLWQNNAAYTGNNAAHFRIVNERTTTGTIGGIQFARTNTADAANAIALIRAEYVGSGRGRFSFSTSPNAGNNTVRMFINYNGHVGIGTTNNPAQRLHVQGNILASGTITPSDARFKRNVQTISSPLSIVNQLRGVSYEFRTNEFPDREFNEGRQFGVIAQEVERVLPELIFDAGDGYKAVNYIGLIPVLLQAIQELSAEVEALRRQINN